LTAPGRPERRLLVPMCGRIVPRSRRRVPTRERSRWSATVREGWNRASYRYRPRRGPSDIFGHAWRDYQTWLRPIVQNLHRGSKVLDLGCGTGVPAARSLARRFRVTGVDISDVQVHRARRLVPQAQFLRADLTEVDFPTRSFAAVIALYSLIHVPREQHRTLFRRVARWLVPGGWFLAILGRTRYEGAEAGWLGSTAPMLWSHHDSGTYRRWLREEGYRILREEFIPEDGGGHELFLARTRRRAGAAFSGRTPVSGSGRPARAPPRPSRAHRPRAGRAQPPSRSASGGRTRRSGR